MQGRLIGVWTLESGGRGIGEDLWAAAIDDDAKAIAAVRAAEATTSDQDVVVRASLTEGALAVLGLSAGQVGRIVLG